VPIYQYYHKDKSDTTHFKTSPNSMFFIENGEVLKASYHKA